MARVDLAHPCQAREKWSVSHTTHGDHWNFEICLSWIAISLLSPELAPKTSHMKLFLNGVGFD